LAYEQREVDGLPTHYAAYKTLREKIRRHVLSTGNVNPTLALLAKPKEEDYPMEIPEEIRNMVNNGLVGVELEPEN
jgi:hypothetical protein